MTSGVDFDAAIREVSKDAGQITQGALIGAAVLGAVAFGVSKLPASDPSPDDVAEQAGSGLRKLGKKLPIGGRDKISK